MVVGTCIFYLLEIMGWLAELSPNVFQSVGVFHVKNITSLSVRAFFTCDFIVFLDQINQKASENPY